MNRRRFLHAGLGAAAGAWTGGLARRSAAATPPTVPSTDEIFGWVEDIWRFGRADRYGYRMPGTKSDRQTAEYLQKKFVDFGLRDTRLEPLPVAAAFPDTWTLTVQTGGRAEGIPCHFLRYARFTGPAGVSAPLVYVGLGTDADFDKVDVTGKIVVVDVVSDGLSTISPHVFFRYDPQGTLAGDKVAENWPPDNFATYQQAVKRGAAGFIGILELMSGDMNQYLHVYLQYELPAVTISPRAGARLRAMLSGGTANATIVLTGFKGQAETFNVYGFVPGRNTDEIIVMMSHHDGWATNDASGTAVVLGLAKYFGQLPPRALNRTLMFFLAGSHFGAAADWSGKGVRGVPPEKVGEIFNMTRNRYDCLAWKLLPRTVCANNVEMIGRQYKRQGEAFVATGRVCPRAWGVTGPRADQANPVLLSAVRDAIRTHDLDRSEIAFWFAGEATRYAREWIPTVNLISHNPWQFTNNDTPDTVMKEALRPTVKAFIDVLRKEDTADRAVLGPVFKSDAGAASIVTRLL